MGPILLAVLTALLGYGLGKGVPQLVRNSGALARRSRTHQLAFGSLLLVPWLVGLLLLLQVLPNPWLLLPAIGYAAGMAWGRRKASL
ncbi:MAG: hypothetical protein ACOVNL_08315 [Prochlorococcaceae cyanobacterium]|jgi:hypothetical protein